MTLQACISSASLLLALGAAPAGTPSGGAGGREVLSLKVTPLKPTSELGEPVLVAVQLTNEGETPLALAKPVMWDTLRIDVRRRDGTRVAPAGGVDEPRWEVDVLPHESTVVLVPVLYYFELAPGTISIRVRYVVEATTTLDCPHSPIALHPTWCGTLDADPVSVEIVPPRSAESEQFLRRTRSPLRGFVLPGIPAAELAKMSGPGPEWVALVRAGLEPPHLADGALERFQVAHPQSEYLAIAQLQVARVRLSRGDRDGARDELTRIRPSPAARLIRGEVARLMRIAGSTQATEYIPWPQGP